ncbi:MAG TPA: serine/threonine-protein kinase [Chthoniobacter sp.]|jgi:serine/threonine protein kinase
MAHEVAPDSLPNRDNSELRGLDAGELLARGLHSVKPSGGGHAWEPPTPEEVGRMLPQYLIEELLGRGGMGAVYKAIQINLERRVAIKLLPAELATDQEFVARFEREARTLAKLQHSRIVTIHDFGQTPEGNLYFVMEYIDGTNLRSILRGQRLNFEQVLVAVGQVCDALHAAHRLGIIHRDIKPENVLITREGYVKLADFGLARTQRAAGAEGLTNTDVVMGTPDYMAPEQRLGASKADHRSDIFALGVMLYEMLTGEPPRGIFDPPSQKAQVDVRIDSVVNKALQSEPDRRYQQTTELKADVEKIRTTPRAVPVAPKPEPARARKGPLLYAAAGVVVLVIAAGWAMRPSNRTELPSGTASHNLHPIDQPKIPPPAVAKIESSEATATRVNSAAVAVSATAPAAAPVVAGGYETGFEPPQFMLGKFHNPSGIGIGDGHWGFPGGDDGELERVSQIQDAIVRGGKQALMVDGASAGKSQVAVEFSYEHSQPYVVVAADVYLSSSSKQSDWAFAVSDPEGGDNTDAGFNIYFSRSLQMASPGWPQNMTTFPRDRWVYVELRVDINAQTYEVLFDGLTVAAKMPFVTKTPRIRMFHFGTFGGGNDRGYLDNFSFVPNAAPPQAGSR